MLHVPSQILPTFVALPGRAGQHTFILLEDVILPADTLASLVFELELVPADLYENEHFSAFAARLDLGPIGERNGDG